MAGVYPAGRLDRDSEGLMLLTDDGGLQQRLSNPRFGKHKTYLAQVEGVPTTHALQRLQRGVVLKDGASRLREVVLLARAPGWLWPRKPPVRQRRHIPTSWLRLSLQEGRNRQVRRTLAAVELPVLRLIREQQAGYDLTGLAPGEWQAVEPPMTE